MSHTWLTRQYAPAGPVELYIGDSVNGRVEVIGDIIRKDNARRIVACVNACVGITTDALEGSNVGGKVFKLTKQRDELLAALKKAREDINWMLNSEQMLNAYVFDYIDAAITKAESAA